MFSQFLGIPISDHNKVTNIEWMFLCFLCVQWTCTYFERQPKIPFFLFCMRLESPCHSLMQYWSGISSQNIEVYPFYWHQSDPPFLQYMAYWMVFLWQEGSTLSIWLGCYKWFPRFFQGNLILHTPKSTGKYLGRFCTNLFIIRETSWVSLFYSFLRLGTLFH